MTDPIKIGHYLLAAWQCAEIGDMDTMEQMILAAKLNSKWSEDLSDKIIPIERTGYRVAINNILKDSMYRATHEEIGIMDEGLIEAETLAEKIDLNISSSVKHIRRIGYTYEISRLFQNMEKNVRDGYISNNPVLLRKAKGYARDADISISPDVVGFKRYQKEMLPVH